jgi:hypothetical protein
MEIADVVLDYHSRAIAALYVTANLERDIDEYYVSASVISHVSPPARAKTEVVLGFLLVGGFFLFVPRGFLPLIFLAVGVTARVTLLAFVAALNFHRCVPPLKWLRLCMPCKEK